MTFSSEVLCNWQFFFRNDHIHTHKLFTIDSDSCNTKTNLPRSDDVRTRRPSNYSKVRFPRVTKIWTAPKWERSRQIICVSVRETPTI